MASIESLTDIELRAKLLEYGYDIPISINRELLVKKLKSASQAVNKTGGVGGGGASQPKRHSVGRTRSVDKDTLESRQLAARSKARYSFSQDASGIEEDEIEFEEPTIPQPPPRITQKLPPTSPIVPPAPVTFARVSTLDPNDDERNSNDGGSVYGRRKERYSNYLNLFQGSGRADEMRQSPMYSSRNFSEDESDEETTESSSKTKLQQFGSLLNPRNWKRNSNSSSHVEPAAQLEVKKSTAPSWLSSEFSRLTSTTPRNGHTSATYPQNKGVLNNRYEGRDHHHHESKTDISKILVFVLILFFAVIGGCYYYKGRGVPEIGDNSEKENEAVSKYSKVLGGNYPICGIEGVNSMVCVKQETVKFSRELFSQLKEELVRRSMWKSCGADVEDKITLSSAKTLIYRLSDLTKAAVDEAYRGMLFLSVENPKWGLRIESEAGNLVTTYLDVDELNPNSAIIFADVEQTWLCFLWMTAKSVLNYTIASVLVGGLGFVLVKIGFHYQNKKNKAEKEMFDMIEQILEILYQHYEKTKETGENAFLAVSHIRDELVPPKERQNKTALWNKVAEYISTNESRIREEMQHISGEEFKVWRWLPSASPLSSQRKSLSTSGLPAHLPNVSLNDSGNKWQGQAFEMSDGSPNALPSVTPTTCLKIRQMFDANINGIGSDVFAKIESTILEKCADAFVQHIGIDPMSQEGCVYVKCATKEDARKTYMALHGWWFDGHLLSVKFLREERYFARFPEVKERKARLVAPTMNQFGTSQGVNNMDGHSGGARYNSNANKSF